VERKKNPGWNMSCVHPIDWLLVADEMEYLGRNMLQDHLYTLEPT